jgi:tetratricopeptide (TPR) repeat protein
MKPVNPELIRSRDADARAVSLAVAGVCASVLAAFSLACGLTGQGIEQVAGDASTLERLLGESRAVFSGTFYMKSDEYFHRGVPHVERRAFSDAFGRLAESVSPTIHAHAAGGGIQEILPWLRFATMMDPRNVQAYRVAAYWLMRSGRFELAEKVLREGVANNLGDYRFAIEQARLYMYGNDLERAARALEAGMRLWPGRDGRRDNEPDEECRLDLSWMLLFRAGLYEIAGDKDNTLRILRRELDLFPDRESHRQQVIRVETQGVNPEDARRRIQALFRAEEGHVCSRGETVESSGTDEPGHAHGP